MTNERAIMRLKHLQFSPTIDEFDEEALDMAIEALSAQEELYLWQKEMVKILSAQLETCEGCKHLGKWENEVEYGYPSPCTRCKRRVEDHYER